MADVTVVLNREGVRALLRADETRDVLEHYASGALRNLGPGYGTSSYVGKNRVNVAVEAQTFEALQENYHENTVLKAVLAGRTS